MALNIQTFKTRALTALLFVIVMLVGLLWNFESFLVLFTIIHFGCWFEYLKLVEKIYTTKIDIVIKWLFAICGFTLMIVLGLENYWFDFYWTLFDFKISIKWCIWFFEIFCLLAFLFQNKQISSKAKWMSFAGLIYISLSFAFFVNLRDNVLVSGQDGGFINLGIITTCGIVFSIWLNDTMAYLVGSFIGKTPLTKISPKKTWEGTVGGIVLCVIAVGFLYPLLIEKYIQPSYPKNTWFIIPAICGIFGTIGDLFESKLKRMADVKDSGSFMPGHGGFLDRFDSLLVAVPAVWVYVYFFL